MSLELFQESYQKTLFMESLIHKKELTLAESIYVLQNEEYYLTEAGLFGKLGGVADKAIDTVIQKVLDNGKTIVQWVGKNVLKGKGKEKTNQEKLIAKNIKGIAQLAGTDKESFFQKVSKWAGTSYLYVKSLFDDLNASLEKIPLVGKFIKMVPAKYRAMILGAVVMMVAKMYISGSFDSTDAAGNDMSQSTDNETSSTSNWESIEPDQSFHERLPRNAAKSLSIYMDQNTNFSNDVRDAIRFEASSSNDELYRNNYNRILDMRIQKDVANGNLNADDLQQFLDDNHDKLPEHTIRNIEKSIQYIDQHDYIKKENGSFSMTLKNDVDLAKVPERKSYIPHTGPIDHDKAAEIDNLTTNPKDSSSETPKNDLDADVAKIQNQEVIQKMDNTFQKVNNVLNTPNLSEDVRKNIMSKLGDVIGHRLNSGEITKDQALSSLNNIDLFKQMGPDKVNTFIDLSLDSAKNQETLAK